MSMEIPEAIIAPLETMMGAEGFPRGTANAVKTKGSRCFDMSGATTVTRTVTRQMARAWAVPPLADTIRTITSVGRGTRQEIRPRSPAIESLLIRQVSEPESKSIRAVGAPSGEWAVIRGQASEWLSVGRREKPGTEVWRGAGSVAGVGG